MWPCDAGLFLVIKTAELKRMQVWKKGMGANLIWITLQGTNISHLGKRKIIFKMPFWGDMLVPRRVYWFRSQKLP